MKAFGMYCALKDELDFALIFYVFFAFPFAAGVHYCYKFWLYLYSFTINIFILCINCFFINYLKDERGSILNIIFHSMLLAKIYEINRIPEGMAKY